MSRCVLVPAGSKREKASMWFKSLEAQHPKWTHQVGSLDITPPTITCHFSGTECGPAAADSHGSDAVRIAVYQLRAFLMYLDGSTGDAGSEAAGTAITTGTSRWTWDLIVG